MASETSQNHMSSISSQSTQPGVAQIAQATYPQGKLSLHSYNSVFLASWLRWSVASSSNDFDSCALVFVSDKMTHCVSKSVFQSVGES